MRIFMLRPYIFHQLTLGFTLKLLTCISNKYVLLMGDFNARTFSKPDFLVEDECFNNHFNYDDNMTEFFNVSSLLNNCKLSELRTSRDQLVNNEGNLLLDICKSNNLLILNGRCGSDKNIGAMTFRNQSVIDYSIVFYQALHFVKMFTISDLDALFSDGHALISTTLQLQ